MTDSRTNFPQSNELLMQRFYQWIEEIYNTGYACRLQLPQSETIETSLQKFCQLAREGNESGIKTLLSTHDERLLKFWTVKLLAYEGDEKSVNFLINKFKADRDSAIFGYAWGGQLSILACMDTPTRSLDKVEGFAFGRHITEVNRILSNASEGSILYDYAEEYYRKGGYIETLPDTLELITLTSSVKLKENLALILKKKIETLDIDLLLAKANKLLTLMVELKIDYAQSLKILTEVENNELATNNNDQTNISFVNQSITLFKQAVSKKLTIYAARAIEECRMLGLTENIILDWQPPTSYPYPKVNFSFNHFQVLKYLLEQKLSPKNAINEINRLNEDQARALIELYAKGLRGDHLRAEQKNGKRFTSANLESLLQKTLHENQDPIVALQQIFDQKPTASAVYRKV